MAEYDETSFARRVADHLGTEHREFQVTPDGVESPYELNISYVDALANPEALESDEETPAPGVRFDNAAALISGS